jgi:hypothetical protein
MLADRLLFLGNSEQSAFPRQSLTIPPVTARDSHLSDPYLFLQAPHTVVPLSRDLDQLILVASLLIYGNTSASTV